MIESGSGSVGVGIADRGRRRWYIKVLALEDGIEVEEMNDSRTDYEAASTGTRQDSLERVEFGKVPKGRT